MSCSGIMEQAHQTGSAVDLAWIFGSGLDPGNAGINTLMPNVGLSWDSIQSDHVRLGDKEVGILRAAGKQILEIGYAQRRF